MKILFVNGFYYLPQTVGGLAQTLDQLTGQLIARGHEVVVLAEIKKQNNAFSFVARTKIKLRKLLGSMAATRDTRLGYPVWRAWSALEMIAPVGQIEKPDVIVIMGGDVVPVAEACKATGTPTLVQIHDVEFHELSGDFTKLNDMVCVANSQFTAEKLRETFGTEAEVILPLIELDRYEMPNPGDDVLFIHPVAKKGARIALQLVKACPDIPFTFVGETHFTTDYLTELGFDETPPNLTVIPFQSDMRDAYRRCRVLLVPSQWEEAYGRVVNEAQISGIPVLASNRGGLPEAVSDGGILVAHDAPIEEWAYELNRIWSDGQLYSELSQKASLSARRQELQLAHQMEAHEAALHEAIARHLGA